MSSRPTLPGKRRRAGRPALPKPGAGFSLVELMIALALGLLLMLGVTAIFSSNNQVFRTSNNLARIQETARFTFELLARDLRDAGGNPCGVRKVANVLNNPSTYWWADWDSGPLVGSGASASNFADVTVGGGTEQRVAGTHAFYVLTANDAGGAFVTGHDDSAVKFVVSSSDHGLVDGSIAMVCDNTQAAIFQVTSVSGGGTTDSIFHQTHGSTPGNCTKKMGYPIPANCSGSIKDYAFADNGMLAKLAASVWYVGNNSRGGRSLFRVVQIGSTRRVDEIAENVWDMQLQYLTHDPTTLVPASSWVAAEAIYANSSASSPHWSEVIAIDVDLALRSDEAVGTDGAPLQRKLRQIIHMRNRESG